MQLYTDSSFYEKEFLLGRKATISSDDIAFYLRKAQIAIKPFILNNADYLTEIPLELKMCQCEIAELLYKNDKREESSDGVVSESVSGWSKSYESGELAQAKLKKKIIDCIYSHLSGTGLLYRGVKG